MAKKRKFRQADYAATESTQITLGEALPEGHLARFIVSVVGLLDLSEIYGEYSDRGAPQGHPPYAPEVLLALLLYGCATGTISSRKMVLRTRDSARELGWAGLHGDPMLCLGTSRRGGNGRMHPAATVMGESSPTGRWQRSIGQKLNCGGGLGSIDKPIRVQYHR